MHILIIIIFIIIFIIIIIIETNVICDISWRVFENMSKLMEHSSTVLCEHNNLLVTRRELIGAETCAEAPESLKTSSWKN